MTSEQEQKRERGTVKWFDPTKGYGFILPESGSGDVFLHIRALERAGLNEVTDGQSVSFVIKPGKNGRCAAEDIELV